MRCPRANEKHHNYEVKYIMTDLKKQAEVLEDKTSTGHERPWVVEKVANERLSEAYMALDASKAERLSKCARILVFRVDPATGRKKLDHADFCRVRLCPVCTWRRSLKLKAQGIRILTAMMAEYPYVWVMLTLTVRNVQGPELSDMITAMNKAWNRFVGYKEFRKLMDASGKYPGGGWHRATEVTHNIDPASPSYDTFHPHFHVLMAVPRSYFTGAFYIKHAEWQAMWRKAMRLDYDPSVDVRKAYDSKAKTIAEAMKYAAKSSEYLIPDDWDLTVETVAVLDQAFDRRRFSAFGGVMKQWHKKLNLDNPEDGDLVHTGDEDDAALTAAKHLVTYIWYTGYRQYRSE